MLVQMCLCVCVPLWWKTHNINNSKPSCWSVWKCCSYVHVSFCKCVNVCVGGGRCLGLSAVPKPFFTHTHSTLLILHSFYCIHSLSHLRCLSVLKCFRILCPFIFCKDFFWLLVEYHQRNLAIILFLMSRWILDSESMISVKKGSIPNMCYCVSDFSARLSQILLFRVKSDTDKISNTEHSYC